MQSRAPRSSLSKRIPATRWEEVRGTIRKLYIDEGRELKDLRDFMAEVHHFDATYVIRLPFGASRLPQDRISQYTTKLKTWGLRKYANRDVWNGVNGALKRRRLDITEADVSHNGMRMTLKKLKKELPRYSRIVQHSTTNCEDHGKDQLPRTSFVVQTTDSHPRILGPNPSRGDGGTHSRPTNSNYPFPKVTSSDCDDQIALV
jgi:hypothetical protein